MKQALYIDGRSFTIEDLKTQIQENHLMFRNGVSYAALCFDRNDALVTIIQGREEEEVRQAVDAITEVKGVYSTEYVSFNTLQ